MIDDLTVTTATCCIIAANCLALLTYCEANGEQGHKRMMYRALLWLAAFMSILSSGFLIAHSQVVIANAAWAFLSFAVGMVLLRNLYAHVFNLRQDVLEQRRSRGISK